MKVLRSSLDRRIRSRQTFMKNEGGTEKEGIYVYCTGIAVCRKRSGAIR